MGLVEEFLGSYFKEWHCDHCGRHFPRSVLVSMDYPFKGFSGQFCTVCCHKIYDLMEVCSECGEDYPKGHLYKNLTSKEYFCKRCLKESFEDDPEG